MSDNLLVAIIISIPGILAAVLGFINNTLARRSMVIQETNAQHLAKNTEAVGMLKEQTNGLTETLVKVTGEAEYAKGLIAGHDIHKQSNEHRVRE